MPELQTKEKSTPWRFDEELPSESKTVQVHPSGMYSLHFTNDPFWTSGMSKVTVDDPWIHSKPCEIL